MKNSSATYSNQLIFSKMMAEEFWSLPVCDDKSTSKDRCYGGYAYR